MIYKIISQQKKYNIYSKNIYINIYTNPYTYFSCEINSWYRNQLMLEMQEKCWLLT